MDKVINCSCGVAIRGTEDDTMVRTAREHAQEVHQMELTDDQARAMIQPA